MVIRDHRSGVSKTKQRDALPGDGGRKKQRRRLAGERAREGRNEKSVMACWKSLQSFAGWSRGGMGGPERPEEGGGVANWASLVGWFLVQCTVSLQCGLHRAACLQPDKEP